ncbi:MAG: hypothetical protein AB8B87_25720 [Granulosicoccus sp.]
MRQLLHQYFNIAFLMGKPQDLPGGKEQLKIGVVLALITYVVALAAPYGISRALLQAIVDLTCTAVVLHVALIIMGHQARFDQAFGGLCGASAIINLVALPLYTLRPSGEASQGPSLSVFADFVLLVWGLSLLGHVIRHTFEVSMVTSIFASFVYFVLLSTLIATFLPIQPVVETTLSVIDESLNMNFHWQTLWKVS